MELTTAVRFFAQYGQASPAQVMRLALAVRADSTGTGVLPPTHTRERTCYPLGLGKAAAMVARESLARGLRRFALMKHRWPAPDSAVRGLDPALAEIRTINVVAASREGLTAFVTAVSDVRRDVTWTPTKTRRDGPERRETGNSFSVDDGIIKRYT